MVALNATKLYINYEGVFKLTKIDERGDGIVLRIFY